MPASKTVPWRRLLSVEWAVRIALAVLVYYLVDFAVDAKKPWETNWQARLDQGLIPSFKDYLAVGFWRASIVTSVVLSVLLVSSFWWMRCPRPPVFSVAVSDEIAARLPGVPRRWFHALILVAVLVALPSRWARMDFPLWGDEAGPVYYYVHGRLVPVDDDDPQGQLEFQERSWKNVLFDDRRGGNNHYLLSLAQRLSLAAWQRATGSERHVFSERALRIAPLLAGLALIPAVAYFLRRLKFQMAGVFAAIALAVHPWMIGVGSEARGYSMLLLFVTLATWALVNALESGRWRWFIAFAASWFLALYSWKGAVIVIASLCAASALIYLVATPRDGAPAPWRNRFSGIVRMVVANSFALALFALLYIPCHAQIFHFGERHNMAFAQTMDFTWAKEVLSLITFGTEWEPRFQSTMEFEGSLLEITAGHPWMRWLSIALLAGTFLLGFVWWWRNAPRFAALLSAVFAAPFLFFTHYKFVLEWGMLPVYSIFVIPSAVITACSGMALVGGWLGSRLTRRPAVRALAWVAPAVAVAAVFLVTVWPALESEVTVPTERLEEAFALSRGEHEPRFQLAGSDVYTFYIGRRAWMYDPREIREFRDAASLESAIAERSGEGAPIYVVCGNLHSMAVMSPALVEFLNESGKFEIVGRLDAKHPLLSLIVYRFRGDADSQSAAAG